MRMSPGVRKLALTAHVTASVGWLGAVAGSLGLAVAGMTSEDVQTVRAAYLGLEFMGWFVLVPFAVASLLTGLVQSLGSAWGWFRHYQPLRDRRPPAVHPNARLPRGRGRPGDAVGS